MTKKHFVKFFTFVLILTFVFSAEVLAQKKPNKKARNLATTAGKLYGQQKYADAVAKFAEALSISPYFPMARFFKGDSHYRLGQYDDAISELNTALEQGFDADKVYTVRMEVYAAKGDFQNALSDAQEAIKLKPNDAYYNAFLGRMYLTMADFQTGVNYLEKSVQQGTRDPNVYYYLAIGYSGMGNFAKQSEYADKALKSGTQFGGNSWYLIADAFQRDRKYQQSANAFINAINAFENDIQSNRATSETEQYLYNSIVSLADNYRNLNKFDEAITTTKRGLSLRSSDPNLHVSLTWYYSLAGRREEAVIAGKRAVELAPNQYMAHTNLCRAYNDEAEFFYDKDAISMANKSFNNAINSCKKALQLEPNDGETNYYLGRAYFYLDNDKLSKTHYEKSVAGLVRFTENNPDYSDGFYLLGNAYFATNQLNNAVSAYSRCLEIAPRFARVRYNLGFVYNKLNKKAEAREQLAILQQLDTKLAKKLSDVIEGKS